MGHEISKDFVSRPLLIGVSIIPSFDKSSIAWFAVPSNSLYMRPKPEFDGT